VKPQREQVKKCLLGVRRARIHLYQFRIQLAILIVGSGNSCKVNWVVENCEGWMAYQSSAKSLGIEALMPGMDSAIT
jgi:hypothetical protein